MFFGSNDATSHKSIAQPPYAILTTPKNADLHLVQTDDVVNSDSCTAIAIKPRE